MQTRLSLRPGQKGTKKLVAEYGDRLVAVRYRYDVTGRRRYKTVELIVEEATWEPKPRPDEMVGVKVQWGEAEVARQVKAAGGQWNARRKVWELAYREVVRLKLEKRLVWEPKADGRKNERPGK